MSVNAPPNPNISTFNNEYWNTFDAPLTQAEADLRYLKFPIAQGTENLQAVNISGAITSTGANTWSNNQIWTGTQAYFNNTTAPVSEGIIVANDNAKNMPTTAWVQSLITARSLLGLNNTWTGTNSFTNTTAGSLTSSATQPVAGDSSTNIPTTAWVQTAITAVPSLLGLNNTWTGTNSFSNTTYFTGTFNQFIGGGARVSFAGSPYNIDMGASAYTADIKSSNYTSGEVSILNLYRLEFQNPYNLLNNPSGTDEIISMGNATNATGVAGFEAKNLTKTITMTTGGITMSIEDDLLLNVSGTATYIRQLGGSAITTLSASDSSYITPTTAWVQSAITANIPASTVLSSALIGYNTPNYSFGSLITVISGNSATQFADVYILGGGGNGSLQSSGVGGGAGGAGGSVIYNRVPMGNVGITCKIEPRFINTGLTAGIGVGAQDTQLWSGTFTQSGTTITLTAGGTGTVSVGGWIQIPITSTNYYSYTYTQLYIVSGSGLNWTCLSSQTQTISPAISGLAAINNVSKTNYPFWTGTLTQSGTTITIVSTASGTVSAANISTANTYCIINGVTYTIQSILANSGLGTLTTNCSQTISTATTAVIYGTAFGTNASASLMDIAGCSPNYTRYPFLGWSGGGNAGTNGTGNIISGVLGKGGAGGSSFFSFPQGFGSPFTGGTGQDGLLAATVGSTAIGGQNIVLNGRTTNINGTPTLLSIAYNAGSTISFAPSPSSAYTTTNGGSGTVAVILYNS